MERWLSPRGLTMFASGASVGLLAGRLLPPLLSQAAASLDTMREGDPFAVLMEDHRQFSSLLEKMVYSRGHSMANRLQLLMRLKRRLAAHAMAEEDVIYPLLHDQAKAEAEAAKLYADHGAIKTHLYGLERSIGDESAWIARATELKALIEDHAAAEEEVEFPKLRGMLDETESARMARHVRREKAMIL